LNSDFWHDKWKNNKLGWHLDDVNPILVNHINKLSLSKGNRILVPLCGKTLDIAWLLSQGFNAIGAELSFKAIDELFINLNIKPKISKIKNLTLYSTDNLEIFVGDIFDIDTELLKDIDAVYDRAALVALPKDMRPKYTKHILNITKAKPQLVVNLEYDQNLMGGPPFCVLNDEVKLHYANSYTLELLESIHVTKLAGKCDALENVWLLNN